ncbi:phage portal protein [Clostridium sp. JS66]|uniref:phage portal protein n=1 Tax=Clostridium sp. JS66 TaxID=3064705 RepID=UPI00298DB7C5|nr:phage portal protein [Clostridium sp. JS66]WPC42949.1 phage portal protein [Clostridium sp. JS66]
MDYKHTIKNTLLNLNSDSKELRERKRVRNDYYFFLGECKEKDRKDLLLIDEDKLGMNWITTDDIDYVPAEDIRNKVKPLLRKQARFMFSKEPDILFKPYLLEDKDKCEELRQFIDGILEDNSFWSLTLKAFLMCTIKKRVLLRLEINPSEPIKIYYEDIKDFSYTANSNTKEVETVTIVKIDPITEDLNINDQVWLKYTYFMEGGTCKLNVQSYHSNLLDKPFSEVTSDTKLSRLPMWVVINGGLLNEEFGESDLEDLRSPQNQYNRKVSDFADALRFNMFPQTVTVDATPDSVNKMTIAPNALAPLISVEGKTATVQKLETNFSGSEALENFLNRIERDMRYMLDMPSVDDLNNIPSAKALKYIYNDLVARCEEKWKDWENVFREMILLIIESCIKFKCYATWKEDWNNLDFKILFKHNYPIPEDVEDKKNLAMSEVNANLKSRKTYIKEFGDVEDYETEWKEILEEIQEINEVENDQFIPDNNTNGDVNGN